MSPSRVLTPAYKMENMYFISTCRRRAVAVNVPAEPVFPIHSTLDSEHFDNASRKLNELEKHSRRFAFLISHLQNPPYFPAFSIEDGGEGGKQQFGHELYRKFRVRLTMVFSSESQPIKYSHKNGPIHFLSVRNFVIIINNDELRYFVTNEFWE